MDRRIIKSKQALKQALQKLIQVDEFRHLTIEEIFDSNRFYEIKAGCARSTFYSHFESKEELLVEIIDEQMAKIERLIARRFDDQLDFYRYLEGFVTEIVEPDRPFFQSLLAINLGPDGFRSRLDQAFQELFMKHLGHLKSSHILSQYFSAMALKTTDLMVTESIAGQDMRVYAKLAQAMCKAVVETSKNFGN